jgi:hypothetical protein
LEVTDGRTEYTALGYLEVFYFRRALVTPEYVDNWWFDGFVQACVAEFHFSKGAPPEFLSTP